MSVKLQQSSSNGNLVTVTASDKLTKSDYEHFVPLLEEMINKHGKIRILFRMEDFHGWDAGALWEDIKFDWKHFSDIEKVAMLGDSRWERWMAGFCTPFTTATIRYFDAGEGEAAEAWLAGTPN